MTDDDALEIEILQTWQWVCWSCPQREVSVPGAYGDGDTFAEVSEAVAEHRRVVHGGRA